MALQHLRSSTADKRPTPGAMSDGQLALNTNLVSPGLFFKDSNGDSVKIGPIHVGATAPNATPGAGGQAGNSKGEAWLDTTATNPILKVFNGSAFVAVQPVGTGTVVSTTDTGTVTSTMILDGTIVNADVNASAAIAGTKISPDFGSQTIATTGIVSHALGTAGAPTVTFTGDTNTGIYSPGADQVGVVTNGVERVKVGTTEVVFNEGGVDCDFRIEGDTNPNLFVVDAGTDEVHVANINGGPLSGFRNAIINGGMQIAQRAAPTITDTPQYGRADRFVAFISGGTGISGTIEQSADAQFKSGYRLWLANLSYTNGTWAIQQKIESSNSVGLNGLTVTVSFKIYHDFGSSRAVGVSLAKANALDNFGSVTAVAAYTSPALTSGAYSNVSCSFAIGASDATTGLLLQINDSSSTTVSAKNILIGDVQLEIGPVATPFERRPIGTELALCQRYFQTGQFQTGGVTASGVGMYGQIFYQSEYRATPTLVFSSVGAVGNFDTAVPAVASVNNTKQFSFFKTATATGSGIYSFIWTGSSEL